MNYLRAYVRERLPLSRFGPLALLLGLLGGPPRLDRAAMIGLAALLIAIFRIRDDLADRERDAIAHPHRVLIRARSTRPFEIAVALGLALAFLGLSHVHGFQRGLVLLGLGVVFELGYRLDVPGRHRWVLLKYPIFALLLADALPVTLAVICYLSFAVHERLDDETLRSRPDAELRLATHLLLALLLGGLHLRLAEASFAWMLVFGGLWAFAVEAARGRAFVARFGLFLVCVLLWCHDHLAQFHACAQALWLALPVTLAGLTHVAVIRRGALARLSTIRLDGRIELRGRPLFGENKTLRGAIVMIGACMFWTLIVDLLQRVLGLDESLRFIDPSQLGSLGLGLVLGLAYVLGELPNSFIKRQLDIGPGAPARGRARPWFWLLDQLDSTIAIIAVLSVFRTPSLTFVATLLGLTLIVHPAVAAIMVALGLKQRVG